jgi:hypothetical protein
MAIPFEDYNQALTEMEAAERVAGAIVDGVERG